MTCYIVINEENHEEMEFEDIVIAQRTLVSLVDNGIKVTFIIDNQYQFIKLNNKYDSHKSTESGKE